MIYNDEALSFRILTVDRFFHKQGIFHVKARPYAAFSFRVSGTGAFDNGRKRLTTNPGDVLFVPANMSYQVEYSVSESIVVHFECCNYSEIENICLKAPSHVEAEFQYLLNEWAREHSVNRAKSIIYDIFEKIETDQKASISDTSIINCIRYIDANFCDATLNLQAVCNATFISVSSLQRAFVKYFGMSPKQYIIRLRMEKALELLMKNDLPVKEISFSCGFSDEKYFARVFKEKYGYPPSRFRNHMAM